MENIKAVESIISHGKLKKTHLFVFTILILALLVLYNLHRTITFLPSFITWALILIYIVIIFVLARKFYNWNLFFLLIILTSFYLKSRRLAGNGILLSLGFSGLSCMSIYSSYVFLARYNKNTFLKYIGFASSLILSIVCIGILWKNMHWPWAGVMLNIGMIFFIPFLFVFVFTIPNSNYINWDKTDRIIFFRAIILPMIFVYILCVFMFVLSDVWASISRLPVYPFGMSNVELLNKPGL